MSSIQSRDHPNDGGNHSIKSVYIYIYLYLDSLILLHVYIYICEHACVIQKKVFAWVLIGLSCQPLRKRRKVYFCFCSGELEDELHTSEFFFFFF